MDEEALREIERQAKLDGYRILDTPREPAFDRITRIVSTMFQVPVALVSLVDRDRQWFKASCGMEMSESPRAVAFCDYAIRASEVMVVSDARCDPRFADNPLVLGPPHTCFYAGAPLITPEGFRIGTLCILDKVPRRFDERQRQLLADMAALVIDELELRLATTAQKNEIDRRAAAETALEDHVTTYRSLVDNLTDVIFSTDADGLITFVNPAWTRLTGFTREETFGRPLLEHVHTDSRASFTTGMREAIRGSVELRCETRFATKRGGARWFAVTARDGRATGQASGMSGFLADVTARREAEQALRRSEARNRSILETALDCIITMDDLGRIVEFNPAAETCFGVSRDDTLGRDFATAIIPAGQRDRHYRGMASFAATGASSIFNRRIETTALRADGSEFPVELAFTPYTVAGRSYFTAHLRDITERRRIQAELESAHRQAEAANRAKSTFLAMMSHEIRSPMTGVLGVLDVFEETALTAQQRHLLELARSSTNQLTMVIDDILDVSKMEAGRFDLEDSPYDPRRLAQDLLAVLRPRAEKAGLVLALTIGDGLPPTLRGDGGRVRQVLLNLIDNALKFTASGGVTVRLRPAAAVLRVEVEDTGRGLDDQDKGLVFREFEQIDRSYARRYGGAGLGLAICRRLVELMGGSIGVESARGRGSLFWFELPLRVAPAPAAGEGSPVDAPACHPEHHRLLLVEDGDTNRLVLAAILRRVGYEVIEAADGRDAIAKVRDLAPDLVLMDVSMPEMDGLEATRLIRAMPDRALLPVIALTANAMPEDRERCTAAGMNDLVAKPVKREQFLATVSSWLRHDRCGSRPPSPAIDQACLAQLAEDAGHALLPDIAASFVTEGRARLDRIRRATADSDERALWRELHTLKSSAATFGAVLLRAKAAELEQAAAEGRLDRVAAALPELGRLATQAFDLIEAAVADPARQPAA